jgi:hypothetical protein
MDTASAMKLPYHITVFDSFRRHEPEEAWVSGTYATAEEAIAAVKSKIDDELTYFWSEVCSQDKGTSTLDRLISHYNSFAELPVAFDDEGSMIFDSTAYMKSQAAEAIGYSPVPYGVQDKAPRQPSAPVHGNAPSRSWTSKRAKPRAGMAKPLSARFAPILAFLNKPRPPTVLLLAFIVFCLLFGFIYRASR